MKTAERSLTKPAYRSAEVVDLAGVSYRQLDFWDRSGLLKPSLRPAGGSGGDGRLYSPEDVKALRTIAQLLRAGVSLQTIRRDGDPRITLGRVLDELAGYLRATEAIA